MDALWHADALVAAVGATRDGEISAAITGFSIDTRTLEPGDVFVAITDQRDGHDFVSNAFAAGAAAALVRADYERRDGDGALFRVDDPLAALERIGVAARARLHPDARVIAVTGSAGKTTTKEMLRAAFEAIAPGRVHASEKSYNNHWGVPLTLARMPAGTMFGVFEIGMSHAGEIRPLTKMVRPDIAIITSVLPVHIGNFEDGIDGIARAKAEIFEGLTAEGVALVPADSDHAEELMAAAHNHGARLQTFGEAEASNATARIVSETPHRLEGVMSSGGREHGFRLAIGGRHNAVNATAVLATVGIASQAAGAVDTAAAALASLEMTPQGRGQVFELSDGITLVDESYNANPASVAAALATQSLYPQGRRRLAVLGDMLELGAEADALHLGLEADINEADIAALYCCGPHMKTLYDALPESRRGAWVETSSELVAPLLAGIRGGDVIMVKGSLGSRMAVLTDALKDRYPKAPGPAGPPNR
ncbi:MAG: UDP-N-acetylmuramoyl-tripeptide--D-alanyl-D-alanine ligase [Pseudomonadota bacterium]